MNRSVFAAACAAAGARPDKLNPVASAAGAPFRTARREMLMLLLLVGSAVQASFVPAQGSAIRGQNGAVRLVYGILS